MEIRMDYAGYILLLADLGTWYTHPEGRANPTHPGYVEEEEEFSDELDVYALIEDYTLEVIE